MRRAIVVGSKGQDGRLLARLLSRRGYAVRGVARGGPVDVRDAGAVERLVARFAPDEIYYLAAVHHSSQDSAPDSPRLLARSWDVNTGGLANFLEAVRRRRPRARVFYAASSLVFGAAAGGRADERTPLAPRSIYGVTKAAGLLLCRLYRSKHGLFASTGILFNHESALRDPKFVSRKIVRGAVAIKKGSARKLVLGDLDAAVDWGYAPDYVEAMAAVLKLRRPGEFVIASGRARTVREFAATAFAKLGLDWREHVVADRAVVKRRRAPLVGDASKLRRESGWRPRTPFDRMVEAMIQQEEASWPRR